MPVAKTVTARVLARDGYRCVIAGPDCLGVASCPDHRAGRGSGGDPRKLLDDPANLIAACGICNGRKEDATGAWADDLIRRGIRVRRHGAPSRVVLERVRRLPVEYPDGVWWTLDSEGGRVECLTAVGGVA